MVNKHSNLSDYLAAYFSEAKCKVVIMCGLSLNANGVREENQLKQEQQNKIHRGRAHFENRVGIDAVACRPLCHSVLRDRTAQQ